MKAKFTRNAYGVKIKRCCASCKFKKILSEEGRVCGKNSKEVSGSHCCKHWEMSRRLQNAGMSGGEIKSWRYLSFYREKWIEQREKLIAEQITAEEMLSTEDIRKEFNELYGSEFINF